VNFDNEMSHLLLDIEELSRTNPQLKATDLVSALNPRNNDSYNPDDLQYGAVSTPVELHTCTYIQWTVSTAVNHLAN
jgi:hypothetical protein